MGYSWQMAQINGREDDDMPEPPITKQQAEQACLNVDLFLSDDNFREVPFKQFTDAYESFGILLSYIEQLEGTIKMMTPDPEGPYDHRDD